tara:strand:+ start:9 stop:338 length:330 start_codon:yes stop_codon:yes gene_type:complete
MYGMWSKTSNKIKNMMYLKIHESEHSRVIAVCDESLIGKKISKELNISESFYKGELKEKEEVIKILKESSNANLIGDEAVSCGIEAGIISKDSILLIGGIKHAQFYSFE